MENDDGFWFKQKLCQWIYERNSSSGTVLPTLDTNMRPNSSHFCPLTKVVLCSSFTRKNWNTIGLKCRDTFQKSIGLQFLHKTLNLSEFATSLKKFAKNRAFWNATISEKIPSVRSDPWQGRLGTQLEEYVKVVFVKEFQSAFLRLE